MATDAANKIALLPAGADLVSRAAYVAELTKIDLGLAHMVALQNNASTTAYTTDAPFRAFYTGMKFAFLPIYANTGAATLAVNGLAAKKLCDSGGTQLSVAGAIQARALYWLEYDAALDGANGGFRVYSPLDTTGLVATTGAQSIAGVKTFNDSINAADTVAPIYGSKFMITPEGGYAVKLTNRTGADSVKGSIAAVSTSYDNSIKLCPTNSRDIVGFVYENGIADGSEVYVVNAGVAPVLMSATAGATRGEHCVISNATAGRARSMADPGDHEYFCGRFLANAAPDSLASIIINWRQDG